MKQNILLTVLTVAVMLLCSCNGTTTQSKMKTANEIEKLTQEQYAIEVSNINMEIFEAVDKLLDEQGKIDEKFEREIDKLHKQYIGQILEYGKAIAQKDSVKKSDYCFAAMMQVMKDMEKIDKEKVQSFEERLNKLEAEFGTYNSKNLKRKIDELFSFIRFLDTETVKEEFPETAKEFGIE